MERFNFQVIEKKWQEKFSKQNLYREEKKEILLSRNVSISLWQNPYGACKKLYYR